MFNPDLEGNAFLIRWMEYRIPGSSSWTQKLSRPNLIHAVVRDMVLHGDSPSLGMFLDFKPETPSLQFLADWLAWFGVIPAPDLDVHKRSDRWWRYQAEIQLRVAKSTRTGALLITPQNVRALDKDFEKLTSTLTALRAAKGRLLENFELLETQGLGHLSPRNFRLFLSRLISNRARALTKEDLLPAENDESKLETEDAWALGRYLRALRASVGTSMDTFVTFVNAPRNGALKVRAKLIQNPHSNSPVNVSFFYKHLLSGALALEAGAKGVLWYKISEKGKKLVEGWLKNHDYVDKRRLSEGIIDFIRNIIQRNQKGALAALTKVVLHMNKTKRNDDYLGQIGALLADQPQDRGESFYRNVLPQMLQVLIHNKP